MSWEEVKRGERDSCPNCYKELDDYDRSIMLCHSCGSHDDDWEDMGMYGYGLCPRCETEQHYTSCEMGRCW
jgi:predicted amidophosphoribosyltransferase